jgi:hypothetical protein
MAWKLGNSDRTLVLDVNASDDGPVNGTLTYRGSSCQVAGGWAASFSVTGRNFSAFAVTGHTPDPGPIFVAASGIMTGPGDKPENIDIQVTLTSCGDGSVTRVRQTLLPI